MVAVKSRGVAGEGGGCWCLGCIESWAEGHSLCGTGASWEGCRRWGGPRGTGARACGSSVTPERWMASSTSSSVRPAHRKTKQEKQTPSDNTGTFTKFPILSAGLRSAWQKGLHSVKAKQHPLVEKVYIFTFDKLQQNPGFTNTVAQGWQKMTAFCSGKTREIDCLKMMIFSPLQANQFQRASYGSYLH